LKREPVAPGSGCAESDEASYGKTTVTVSPIRHDLVARAKEITAREKAVYSERTSESQIATERARVADEA
jgi:hypothetical protein